MPNPPSPTNRECNANLNAPGLYIDNPGAVMSGLDIWEARLHTTQQGYVNFTENTEDRCLYYKHRARLKDLVMGKVDFTSYDPSKVSEMKGRLIGFADLFSDAELLSEIVTQKFGDIGTAKRTCPPSSLLDLYVEPALDSAVECDALEYLGSVCTDYFPPAAIGQDNTATCTQFLGPQTDCLDLDVIQPKRTFHAAQIRPYTFDQSTYMKWLEKNYPANRSPERLKWAEAVARIYFWFFSDLEIRHDNLKSGMDLDQASVERVICNITGFYDAVYQANPAFLNVDHITEMAAALEANNISVDELTRTIGQLTNDYYYGYKVPDDCEQTGCITAMASYMDDLQEREKDFEYSDHYMFTIEMLITLDHNWPQIKRMPYFCKK